MGYVYQKNDQCIFRKNNMNVINFDNLCTQIMSTLPLDYFRNFAYHRQFITGDFYSTTLKTECQGSWADGFAVLGKSKSDFDLAFPINKSLRISENCYLNIINLHQIHQNPCYVTLEISACTIACDKKSTWLNDLVYLKNDKKYLCIEQLRKRIISKIDELSLAKGFATLCVSTRESQDKLNPCFTINLMLSISNTIKPLQNLIQQLGDICKSIHDNTSAINCVLRAIFNVYEIIYQCGWNEIINFDVETFFLDSNWQPDFENDLVHIFKELFLFRDPICFEHVTQIRNEVIRFSFKFLLLFFKNLKSEQVFNNLYVNDIVAFCQKMKMNIAMDDILSWSSNLKHLDRNNYHQFDDNLTEDFLMNCRQLFEIFSSTLNTMVNNCEDAFTDTILNIELNHCVEENIFTSFQHAIDYFAAKTSLIICHQLKDIIENNNFDKSISLLNIFKMLTDFLIILNNFILSFNESQESMECFQNNPKLPSKLSEFYTEIIRKIRGARLEVVELVPCFRLSGWPEVARNWINRKRYWPERTVIDAILKDGFHVVLKTSPGGDKELETRLSFSHAEIQLFKSFTLMQDVAFYVFKLLFYLELSSPKILSTYYIKTIAFWVYEESSPEFWEKDNAAAKCILLMIERLYDALCTGILYHYFIPEQNLFVSIPREQLVMISRKVKTILLNPVHYIEIVSHYINAFIDPYSKDLWKPCAKVRDIYFYSESLKSYISTYVKIL